MQKNPFWVQQRPPGALFQTTLLVLATLLSFSAAQPSAIDPARSQISAIPNTISDVVNSVTVTTFDNSGTQITVGGALIFLKVEQLCTVTLPYGCTLSAQNDNVAGLPIFIQMTDNTDGTYSADWSVSATGGSVTVSAIYISSFGFLGEYYPNFSYSGTVQTRTDAGLKWSTGAPYVGVETSFAIIWTGYLIVPTTETYTFSLSADDLVELKLDGAVIPDGSKLLQANLYSLWCRFEEWGGAYKLNASWSSPNFSNVIIGGQSAVQDPAYIGDAVHSIEVLRSTIPTSSTIELSLTGPFPAGETHMVEVQGRDIAGVENLMTSDVLTVIFNIVRPASQGPAQQLSVPVTHVSNGLYNFQHKYTLTGDYTVSLTLENAYTVLNGAISIEVGGSPLTFTVVPGTVDPSQCTYQIDSPASFPEQVAGEISAFTIQFVDLDGNLHYDTMSDDGITLVVQAVYQNHDDWPSPIGVEDKPNWQTVYGTTISGTQADNSDGTITADFTIYRAGDYTFSITVNGEEISNSPIQLFQIAPAVLSAPNCVSVDFPQSMTAGYDYSFLIQGRDSYDNNIVDRVGEAVGTDFSATYNLASDNTVSVEASISDDTSLGVYLVEVQLPKTLNSGVYDFVGLLGGEQLPVAAVFINPCTNFQAAEEGTIAQAGSTQMLPEIVYTIKKEAMTASLPLVPKHCEHSFTQILISATATLSNGLKVELESNQLLAYGIGLETEGENPKVTVYSEDLSLDRVSIDLVISATVTEETSWADTTQITILYQRPEVFVFDAAEYATLEPPRFDPDSVNESSLQMGEDDKGVNFLVPLVLDCTIEWSGRLPAILGEDANSKIDLSVDLGDASTVLMFSPTQRVFEHIVNENGTGQVYSFDIKLSNQVGRSSSYSLRVIYKCVRQEHTVVQNSFEAIFSVDPPVPRIESIDAFGEVTVRFDRQMRTEYALSDFATQGASQRMLPDDEIQIARGAASKTYSKFDLIHNRTMVLNGTDYPSMDLRITPDEPGSLCSSQLDFEWEVTEFIGDKMTLMLRFIKPECVSSSSVQGDLLTITFYDQRLFGDKEGKFLWVGTETTKRLNHQIQLDEVAQQVLDTAVDSTTRGIAAVGIFNFLTNLLLQGSLNRLVDALKNLQIIVHVMLIQVYLVGHAEIFLHKIQEMIAFEAINLTKIYVAVFGDLVVNETVDIHFESMGYETSDAILNLGVIFLTMVLTPIILVTFAIASYLCCCQRAKTCLRNQIGRTLFNRVFFFLDGSFLMITVVSALNIYQVYRQLATTNSSYYFSLAWVSMMLPLLALLLGYLCCKVKVLRRTTYRERVGAAYENLDVRNKGRQPFVFLALSYSRRIALSAVVTFGRSSKVAQLFFVDSCSVFLIGYVGIMRPLNSKWLNRLEMGNEYTILLLYVICITQTEFVEKIEGRMAMGWALIVLISANILLNFGVILGQDLKSLLRRLKLRCLKRQAQLKKIEFAQKQAKINEHRARVLEDQRSQKDNRSDVLRDSPQIELKQSKRQGLANQEYKLVDVDVEAVFRQPKPHLEKRHYPEEEEKESVNPAGKEFFYNYTDQAPHLIEDQSVYNLKVIGEKKGALPYVNTKFMTPEEAEKNFGLPVVIRKMH